jgi:TatD DNase family protein
MLIDTHCHIHEADYPLDVSDVLLRAQDADVQRMICVGTSEKSSQEAIQFAEKHDHIFASIGVHPHDTKDGWESLTDLLAAPVVGRSNSKIIAVGEIGLDYFYTHSSREVQIEALRAQISLALAHDLPIIFHVREAFDDFWPIFDSYNGKIKGVLHSFTDSQENMIAAVERGLYIGVNGISTFTKDAAQQEMFASIPFDSLLLETDAPFLTPTPLRGKVNEPAFVRHVAEHHAKIHGLSIDELATRTSANAHALFAL